ncbi:MAG TPA: 2-phospho-L-lactate guanylyltransferase, partial [Microlunatus sp.]|nr:2-phospho-L-lactate guanylyltransferase [Microlunatus sp.]
MDTLPPEEGVAAVVALKTLPAAKSRMSSLPAPLRERLARCMAIDTLAALAPAVDQVLVVSDQPDLPAALLRAALQVRVLAEPPDLRHSDDLAHGDGSLNRALAHGDRLLKEEGFGAVLACVGDLPALRTASVSRVVAASVGLPRCFLVDHDGRGSTMLIARRVPLNPLYGRENLSGETIGSALRHRRSGAVALELGELSDARRDVDTLDDLRSAHLLGTGPATASLLDPATSAPGQYLLVEVLDRHGPTVSVLAEGVRESVAVAAYDGDPA